MSQVPATGLGREVVVLAGVRTAIGTFGGSLKDVPLADLSALVTREAVARSGVDPAAVGHVAWGNVIHTEPRDMYISRVAAINGGLPVETPAVTVNRLCGSGLQAIVTAAQQIELGHADVAVGGGSENMSRSPYWLPSMRWGARMSDATAIDAMTSALTDPFDACHMGITAENIANKWEISREAQDAAAVQSHHRAAAAQADGRFASQIVPVELTTRRGTTIFDTDEHVRPDSTIEGLAKLRPVFDPKGSVTAGNASGINDGAAAVVLMAREVAEAQGLKPMARLVGYAYAGVDPRFMGIGPVPAVRSLLDQTGLTVADLDVIELNEAFAAQALAVMHDLGLPDDRTNPNGSGISLGHPIGATGCVLTVKALYELQRIGGRYALVTMCIGGGQGIAAIFERMGDGDGAAA